jgi:hypothetical protein
MGKQGIPRPPAAGAAGTALANEALEMIAELYAVECKYKEGRRRADP